MSQHIDPHGQRRPQEDRDSAWLVGMMAIGEADPTDSVKPIAHFEITATERNSEREPASDIETDPDSPPPDGGFRN